MKVVYVKWIAFKKILIAGVLACFFLSVIGFVLWRNLLPEYISSVYAEKRHVGSMDIVILVDKAFMPTMHGYPYHLRVWVKGEKSFFYTQIFYDYIGRYFDTDVKKILPQYEFIPKGGNVKFTGVCYNSRSPRHNHVYMLAEGRNREVVGVDVYVDFDESLIEKSRSCDIQFPEIESGRIEEASQKFEKDLQLVEDIKRVASWYISGDFECVVPNR